MTQLPVAQYPTITPVQVTVSATYPGADSQDARRLGRLADRAADQRRRQHAVHVVDQLVDRPADDDRLLLARHRSRHRAGAGAEPRQPRDAAAAVRRRAAGRERAEEVVVDHDAGRGVREGRPLQRQLHRQLRQRLRARRAEARQRRGPGADHGRAQPGDADLDESGPHGLARRSRPPTSPTRSTSRTSSSAPARSASSRTRGRSSSRFRSITQPQFTDPRQYENIILRASQDGSAIVRVGDVARAEIGLQQYIVDSKLNGVPRDDHRRLPAAGRQRPHRVEGGARDDGADEGALPATGWTT